MRASLRPNSFRLLLSLTFSALMVVVLPRILPQDVKAELGMLPTVIPREKNHPRQLNHMTNVSVCQQTQNLVPNPGFEQGIDWPNYWYEAGDCNFAAQGPGHNGSNLSGAILDNPTGNECKLFTPIEVIHVEPNRFYDYSAWIKTAFTNGGQAYLRITFWSRQGYPPTWTFEGEAFTTSVTDTNQTWKQVTGSVLTPADAQYARVEARRSKSGSGPVWFDDIFLGLATCLDISKSDDPHLVLPEQPLSYTIVYSNTGRETATGVQVIETYDKHLDFIKAEPPPDSSNNIWRIGTLEPGHSGTITVVMEVEDDARRFKWLFNTVEIFSAETLEEIPFNLDTQIDAPTGTCAINIELDADSRSGKPGSSVNYDLVLRNAGNYDGQAVLTATSSPNWHFTFVPPTRTLTSGESESVTLSLDILPNISTSIKNVTSITATFDCGKFGHSLATASTTTNVVLPAFLPVVIKDFPPNNPWESEDNDSCSYEDADGPVLPGKEYYGYPDDHWDFWRVEHPGGWLAITLTISAGSGVQLALCNQECEPIARPSPIQDYRIITTVVPGQYYVGIYTESDFSDDQAYTLWVTY